MMNCRTRTRSVGSAACDHGKSHGAALQQERVANLSIAAAGGAGCGAVFGLEQPPEAQRRARGVSRAALAKTFVSGLANPAS
jgi:hypothetical protein